MRNYIPQAVIMVRPSHFGFNEETALSNAFQNEIKDVSNEKIKQNALKEFDQMVDMLRIEGIEVIVFNNEDKNSPDAVFPNNWFSTFTDDILLYPIFCVSRRGERKSSIYETISSRIGKPINKTLLEHEKKGEFLEGTGSLVCDYLSKTAFTAISDRTTHKALDRFEEETGYSTIRFNTHGPDGKQIYHTNVMMCIGDNYAVIGADCIEESERKIVLDKLTSLGKEIILLSNEQVYNHFAGNMLQVENGDGQKFLIMSMRAEKSLSERQRQQISDLDNSIIAPAINTIETIGGGSVRCMMAELFYK